jgi:hypothetical protein
VTHQPAEPTPSVTTGIVGTWWCRGDDNFIHKTVYDAAGGIQEYDSPDTRGVRVEDEPLKYKGSYRLDGDVLRTTLSSVAFGNPMANALKVVELTKDSLVLYYQDLNIYEHCFKPIE